MSERIEVTPLQVRELVLLGMAFANDRLQKVRENVQRVCAEHVAAGQWADAEELTHWGACLDHVEEHQMGGRVPSIATIARWFAQIAEEAVAKGDEAKAATWAALADDIANIAEEVGTDE